MGSGSSRNVKPLEVSNHKATPGPNKTNDDRLCCDIPATASNCKESNVDDSTAPTTLVVRPSSNTKHLKNTNLVGQTNVLEYSSAPEDDTDDIKVKSAEIRKERDQLKDQNELLEKQIGELESHNLDLVERIQVLEEQLEMVQNEKVAKEMAPCVNTVAAKDQYIAKLEKETNAVQNEIDKLKSKYKKKIRLMNSQLSEAKQESSVHVFEMKDELQRLRQENSDLREQINSAADIEPSVSNDPILRPVTPGADRTGLILDLSSQVSAQENKIMDLELKIQEKDKIIEEISNKKYPRESSTGKRSGSARSQSSGEFSDVRKAIDNDDFSVGSMNITGPEEKRSVGLPPTGSNEHSLELLEMKAIAGEMKQMQRKMIKKRSVLKDRIKTATRPDTQGAVQDFHECSGTSRDLGIVMADTELSTTKMDSPWMSSCLRKGEFDHTRSFGDDSLVLQSVTPSLPKTDRTASPESIDSRWTDDDDAQPEIEKADAKSTISISSIRRISAPKKKKKHVLSDQDMIVDSLLRDLDEPLRRNLVTGAGGMSAESFKEIKSPIAALGQ